jgi:hypothetical protein
MLSENLDLVLRRRTALREGSEPCSPISARTVALLGTLQNARSQVEFSGWRGEARRGRADQTFVLGEVGVIRATANSLVADCHGPRQGDQVVKAKPAYGAACEFWIRAWSHASPLFEEPAA